MFTSERKLDALIRRWRWIVSIGVIMVGVSYMTKGPGLFSGMMLVWLGVSAASFQTWRSERGLWRQAAIFAAFVGAVLAFCVVGFIADAMHGRLIPDPPGFMLIDGILWTGILAAHFWFLCGVAKRNRVLSSDL